VQRDAFDADEVVTTRDALWYLEVYLRLVCTSPGCQLLFPLGLFSLSGYPDRETRGRNLTVRRPCRFISRKRLAILNRAQLPNLEPHVPGTVPGLDVLALRHAREVEGDGPKVHHVCRDDKAECVTCRHGGHVLGCRAAEAAHVGAVDVRDTAIVARVGGFGLPHRKPVGGFRLPVDDQSGEFICVAKVITPKMKRGADTGRGDIQ